MDGHVCRLFSCHDFLHFYCKYCYSLTIIQSGCPYTEEPLCASPFLRRRKCVSFHKGTIKTLQSYVCGTISKQFQFHKGTIMTSSVSRTWRVITCFNSIKVRLRPHIDIWGKSPCFLAFPDAKIRKRWGKTCRCGIIKKIRGCDNPFVYRCFNMSKSERIIFLSYNTLILADIDNFYRKLSVDIRSLPSISLSIL